MLLLCTVWKPCKTQWIISTGYAFYPSFQEIVSQCNGLTNIENCVFLLPPCKMITTKIPNCISTYFVRIAKETQNIAFTLARVRERHEREHNGAVLHSRYARGVTSYNGQTYRAAILCIFNSVLRG